MSTGLQSSGCRLSRNIQDGALHGWQLMLAAGWYLSWRTLGLLYTASLCGLGFSQWGSWALKGRLSKASITKERKEKLTVVLRPGLRSPRTSRLLHSIDQSSHKASPRSKRMEISFTFWCERRRVLAGRGELDDSHLWDEKPSCIIFKYELHCTYVLLSH